MEPAKINYKIFQGATFTQTFRWESDSKSYADIIGISKAAPAVINVSNVHTLPAGWRFTVSNVTGMKEINSLSDDYYICTSKSPTTIISDRINSAGYSNYTGGGVVAWNTPVPIAGYTGLLQARETVDSPTVLFSLSSASGGIIIDPANYTITINITSTQTSTFNFSTAIYAMELTSNSGQVITLIRGSFTLIKDIVR